MNPLDGHKLLLWAVWAVLTRDKVRRGWTNPLATCRRRESQKRDEAAYTFAIEVRHTTIILDLKRSNDKGLDILSSPTGHRLRLNQLS